MATTIHLWFHATYSAPYKGGGFAWVRSIDGELSGGAGGERNITFERLELTGLSSAVPGLAAGAPLIVHTANSRLAILERLVAGEAGSDAPEADLDLWARLVSGLGKRPLKVATGQATPNTALGFVSAWAELGRDKAKGGAFKAAIPKSNLLRSANLLKV